MNKTINENEKAILATALCISVLDRGFLLLAAMIALMGWLVMACRMMSDKHPILDLASHLSWHTWVSLSVVAFPTCVSLRVCVGEKRLRWFHRLLMATPPWLYLTWITAPWTMLPLALNDSEAKGLKILSWNIWIMSSSPEEALSLLKESDADVIALIELGPEQTRVLKQLEKIYPYCLWMPDESSRGIAVLSRIEGTRFTSVDLANEGMPAIEADVPPTESHSGYRIMAVHTRSPDLHQRTLDRNKQLQALAEWAALPNKASIIIGDLNITPWSPPFSRLLQQGNLEDSRRYRGNFASWPTDLGPFAIPIDHALVPRNSQVLFRGVGASAPDSDHRPIIVVLK